MSRIPLRSLRGAGAVFVSVAFISTFFVLGAYAPVWNFAPMAMGEYGDSSVRGARLYMAYVIIPNSIAFALTAVVIRRSWLHLTLGQVCAAALFLGFVTLVMILVAAQLVSPLLERFPTPVTWAVFVFPGLVAAQLLRFSRNPSLSP